MLTFNIAYEQWRYSMGGYIFDLTVVSLLVIGITAFMGTMANSIGEKVFGGKQKSEFVDKSSRMQTGWKTVGGKK
jgi:hypothetical protein